MSTRGLLSLLIFLILSSASNGAESARQTLDRAKELEETVRQWKDRYREMHFRIVDATGKSRERELKLYERKYADESQKAILFLLSPSELKGTGLLAFTYKDRSADQWLYLPGIKRTRKVTGNTRDEGFVGSDLTFHDLDVLAAMPTWSEADATAERNGEATVDDEACDVIELTPQREDIGYGRIVLWLAQSDLVPRQLDFFAQAPAKGWLGGMLGGASDASEKPTRRIRQSDVRLVGAIPVAHRIDVESPQNGSQTEIVIGAVRYDQGLEDRFFSNRYLERGGE